MSTTIPAHWRVTYTLDKFGTSDNVRSRPLRLLRCSTFREDKDAVGRLRLRLPRQAVATFRNGGTTFWLLRLDHDLVRSVRGGNLDGLRRVSEWRSNRTCAEARTRKTAMASSRGIFSAS